MLSLHIYVDMYAIMTFNYWNHNRMRCKSRRHYKDFAYLWISKKGREVRRTAQFSRPWTFQSNPKQNRRQHFMQLINVEKKLELFLSSLKQIAFKLVWFCSFIVAMTMKKFNVNIACIFAKISCSMFLRIVNMFSGILVSRFLDIFSSFVLF